MKNKKIVILCVTINIIVLSLSRLTIGVTRASAPEIIEIEPEMIAEVEIPLEPVSLEPEQEGQISVYIPQAQILPDGTTLFSNGTVLPYNVDEWLDEVDEEELFFRLVEAEAGNQSTLGRRLVADCVLNQMDYYDVSYKDIILGENKFESVSNAHIFLTEAQESTIQSCRTEMDSRIDYNVMYFRTEHYHRFGTPYEQVGDHYFSTKNLVEER